MQPVVRFYAEASSRNGEDDKPAAILDEWGDGGR